MQPLNLPTFPAKIIRKEGKPFIYDPLRRKYVALTPEEWVRQHFIQYLTSCKGFPAELIGNEITLKLHATTKRCDTVVYDRFLAPLMIIEYKAPGIGISEAVFDQIMRYNRVLRVRYLVVTNGLLHFCCRIDYENRTYAFLEEIPSYDQLNAL